VKKVEMLLERDEFVVTYDPSKADAGLLIAAIKEAGYTAQVVTGGAQQPVSEAGPVTLSRGLQPLDEALARAKRENRPVVLDFFAEWCAPCRRMEETTFTEARVRALLERCVVVRIDTDRQVDIAQRLGVVGLAVCFARLAQTLW
jgi:thiol:disulfide interchange protein